MKTLKTQIIAIALMLIATATFAASPKEVVVAIKSKNKVNVALTETTDAAVKVRVYNEKGSLLYRDSFAKNKKANRAYDISQFPQGVYTFIVLQNNEVVAEVKVERTFDTDACNNELAEIK